MIVLHQYPAAFNLPSLSPFCLKVEFFLKVAKLPYRVQVELNPANGPKGKMPFIEDGENIVADSSFIIDYLIRTQNLGHFHIRDSKQAAEALALKSMIEESLYFILLSSRWVDEAGYRVVKKEFSPLFPPLVGKPFLAFIRRNLRRQAQAQGIGRHTPSEVYTLGRRQVVSLSTFLGQNQFFFEGRMTVFDATAYAFLTTILKQPIESDLKTEVKKHKNLCSYVERLDGLLETLC